MSLSFAFLLILIGYSSAYGAEIFPWGSFDGPEFGHHWKVKGELDNGDFDRFIYATKLVNKQPKTLWPNSPGGSVEEALKFGRFAGDTFMGCHAANQCNSSCFLILVGCKNRVTSVPLGLHRPFFKAGNFGSLDFTQAKKSYDNLLHEINSYLTDAGISQILVDKMISVPSSSIYFIPIQDFEERVGKNSPAYSEWIRAKCGAMSSREREDLELVTLATFHDILPGDPTNKELMEILREAKRARLKVQEQMSEGYQTYLSKRGRDIRTCEKNAVAASADSKWRKYVKSIK